MSDKLLVALAIRACNVATDCHTGEETYGKKDDVLLVIQKEGIDRFHCRAYTFPPYRREERGPDRGMGLARASNSACGGERRCLFNCFSQITFRLISLSRTRRDRMLNCPPAFGRPCGMKSR